MDLTVVREGIVYIVEPGDGGSWSVWRKRDNELKVLLKTGFPKAFDARRYALKRARKTLESRLARLRKAAARAAQPVE